MIPSPLNVILLAAIFGACILGVAAWISALSNYVSMRANRTDQATIIVRLAPWWFFLNRNLTQNGIEYRARLLKSIGAFLFAIIGITAILGGSLLYCNGHADCLVAHFR